MSVVAGATHLGVESMLSAARCRFDRVTASTWESWRGALVIDIRPDAQRRASGMLPGAAAVDRNVLEWRLDPTSPHRLPAAADPDRSVVLYCQQGYASSLAAAALLDLGRSSVADLVGGVEAWIAAGRSTVSWCLPSVSA